MVGVYSGVASTGRDTPETILLHKMANDRATSSIPKKDTDPSAPADSDSEAEDVFHDARFPADEEAVSYAAPPPATAALSSSLTESSHWLL